MGGAPPLERGLAASRARRAGGSHQVRFFWSLGGRTVKGTTTMDKEVDGPDKNARRWQVLVRTPGGSYEYQEVSYEQAARYCACDPHWREAPGLPGPSLTQRLRRFFW